MKKVIVNRILFVGLFCCINVVDAGEILNLKEIVAGKFYPENRTEIVPTSDGEYYTQMNAEGTQIGKYAFKTGEQVEVIFDTEKARECPFKTFDGYTLSPDGTKMLIRTETTEKYRRSCPAVYYIYTMRRNLVEKLSNGGAQQAPVFSPDGNMIAFVRNNAIFLVKTLFNNSESQVTEDGEPNEISNGIPDRVYEEEFGTGHALIFSPDSKMLAYIRFDTSKVPSFSLQLFAGQSPTGGNAYESSPAAYTYKYPKAGETASTVSVHTFDIKTTVTHKMDLPLEAGGYIPCIRFTQDAEKLAIMTLNRHQNRFDMYYANPRSTVCKLMLRDENPYYINSHAFDAIRFYPENFSLLSEKDGYAHLYWYTIDGVLVKQITSGNFEVNNFLGWDAQSGTFYYESNEESPLHSAIYKIDKKGKKTKLSKMKGTNTALFSPNMKYYVNTYSTMQIPPVVTLNTNGGKVLKTLVNNNKLKQLLLEYDLPTREFFTFTTSQGTELNGWMMKPAGFSALTKYPVLMYQYGAPGSQQVLDRWNTAEGGSSIGWETYMASRGYIIVCVDGRGTGGRGVEFAKCTYLNVGRQETQDQVETAEYLGEQTYVDKNRIGIWGWSFGGYVTIMSMSRDVPVFKAGAAVSPITDWRYYNKIHTERFMRMPKENAGGYEAASAFTYVGNLKGKLLLIHGTADEKVHFQNTIEYSEQLVQAGKQFDMQVYTNRNHDIYDGNTRWHLFTRLTDFFLENL